VPLLEELVVRWLVTIRNIILANLVLGENIVPQILQRDCTPERLAAALVPLLADTPERRGQVEAFARLDTIMEIGRAAPSDRAADVVLDCATRLN
jgi:lipid-A-disaccharide synthase